MVMISLVISITARIQLEASKLNQGLFNQNKMNQQTIEDYLAYNPPRLVIAEKHTTHKTTLPSNPRVDDIELTLWESFAVTF